MKILITDVCLVRQLYRSLCLWNAATFFARPFHTLAFQEPAFLD